MGLALHLELQDLIINSLGLPVMGRAGGGGAFDPLLLICGRFSHIAVTCTFVTDRCRVDQTESKLKEKELEAQKVCRVPLRSLCLGVLCSTVLSLCSFIQQEEEKQGLVKRQQQIEQELDKCRTALDDTTRQCDEREKKAADVRDADPTLSHALFPFL